jgi:hypothetical protein
VTRRTWILYQGRPHIRRITALEGAVRDVRRSSFGSPAPDEVEPPFLMEDINTCPRPGQIFAEIGRVIAVCLGLGVLAHILVVIIGN